MTKIYILYIAKNGRGRALRPACTIPKKSCTLFGAKTAFPKTDPAAAGLFSFPHIEKPLSFGYNEREADLSPRLAARFSDISTRLPAFFRRIRQDQTL